MEEVEPVLESIAKKIGGNLEVKSGVGSTITFEIPGSNCPVIIKPSS